MVRLPEEKLKELRATLQSWRGMKSCRKRELLSIIGSLSHACKAIRAGRSYLRRLIDLSTTVNRLSRRVRLNTMARSDLLWWWEFSQEWNGVAMMVSVNSLSPDIELVTDASGSWGCGAVCGTQWFQLEWDGLGSTKEYGIMAKELLPIVVAAAVWGGSWAGKTVRARCDNQSVMATINTGSCREAEAMHLRRCLAFLEAKGQFHIMAVHIRGVDNVVADGIELMWPALYCWGQSRSQWLCQKECWTWWPGPSWTGWTRGGGSCGVLLHQRGGISHTEVLLHSMEQIQQILQEGGEEPPPGVRTGPVQVRVSLGGGRSSSPHLKRVPSGSQVCTSEG